VGESDSTYLDCTDSVRENRIYTHPKPVHASHGLIMTLRLYHLNQIKTKKNSENMEIIRLGIDTYAEGCEGHVRKSLIELCQKVWDDSSRGQGNLGFFSIDGMKHRQPEEERKIIASEKELKNGADWFLSQHKEDKDCLEAIDSILPLWYERTAIARKLKTGIAAGQKIWD
jgi:hypothetical protein